MKHYLQFFVSALFIDNRLDVEMLKPKTLHGG